MKILDKYIIRKFLGTFFFSILLIIVIVIVFDISEKVDDFIEKKAPFDAIVFDYYLNFIPYFINLFSALFTFIAVIFFTAKLAGNSEVIAILSGGVSFNRLLVPYMVSATVIALLTYVLTGWVIPPANKVRLDFENAYIKNPYHYNGRNIHRQISPGVYIYMESYNNIEKVGYRFSLEKIEKGKLSYKLMGEVIRWDSIQSKWTINQFFSREIKGAMEKIKSGMRMDTSLAFTPQDFNVRINNIETMNNRELSEFIELEKLRGSENIDFYLVEKHRRTAVPFANFILTLIGVSLSSQKVRGGIGLRLGVGLALSFSFILLMQISTTFAINAGFSPLIAVWIPNIIFAALGIWLYRKAPK